MRVVVVPRDGGPLRGGKPGERFTVAGVSEIDAAWTSTMEGVEELPRAVVLDMSAVLYLEHELLLYLVGVALNLQLEHDTILQFRFRDLAASRGVALRDYLLAWNFDEALQNATGFHASHFVEPPGNEKYFERDRASIRFEQFAGGHPKAKQLFDANYFPITKVDGLDAATRAAGRLRQVWSKGLIQEVLSNLLGSDPRNIPDLVVYEAIHNAATHKSGEAPAKAFVASQLVERSDADDEFVLSIWDDGPSFARTLKSRLDRDNTLRSRFFNAIGKNFELLDHPSGVASKLAEYGRLSSDQAPWDGTEEALILSAFCFGITSRAEGDHVDGDSAAQELARADLDHAEAVVPGVGLHYLAWCVVDQFGGSVDYITGEHRFRVEASSLDDCEYAIGSAPQGAFGAAMKGNLLIARFKIRRDGRAQAA